MSDGQKEVIHNHSMKILAATGIVFHDQQAVALFQKHGFKTDDKKVFFSEAQLMDHVQKAPPRFVIRARNAAHNLEIGGEKRALLPGVGAVFIAEPSGTYRSATYEDYENFCKLVQSSPVLTMNGWNMVTVADRPPASVHRDTLLAGITLCDKPFLGAPSNRQTVSDMMTLAGFIWGEEAAREGPFSASVINPLSPLQYSQEMCGALMHLVAQGQAVVPSSALMGGASGPISLEGMLALQNAEILAGIVLAQLVRPGAEVIYGATSAAMDMRSGTMAIGSPESIKLMSLTSQMAGFYRLPCRAGGGLTDALSCDAQAGLESALALQATLSHKIDFILHACGILGSFIAMSYEKFLLDEELTRIILASLEPLSFADPAADLAAILEVGVGGHYLMHSSTLEGHRRSLFLPTLISRQNPHSWQDQGSPTLESRAKGQLAKRLGAYRQPDLEPSLEKKMRAWVERQRG
jgi:trimethylamine--corrinoid protein Co-methyltransferase